MQATQLYPLTPAQSWLLHYFPKPYGWYDRLEFSLKRFPSVGIREVQNACIELMQRHESLRSRFVQNQGEWNQEVLPVFLGKDTVVMMQDMLSSEEELALCRTFDITELPLFKIIMTPLNDDSVRFLILFHHIIIDYIGMVLFAKELCAILDGHMQRQSSSQNTEYVCAVTNTFQKQESWRFWENHFQTITPDPHIPCQGKYVQQMQEEFSIEETQILLQNGKKKFRTASLHAILVAPLYLSWSQVFGNPHVCISHKLHGRLPNPLDVRFFSTIGNYAINVPIVCNLKQNSCISDVILYLNDLLECLPMQGLSYDLTKPSYYPDHSIAPIRMNFMGNISVPMPKNVLIDPKTFSTRLQDPEQPLTTFVEMFIFISLGKLKIELAYDSIRFNQQEMIQVIQQYSYHLKALIKALTKEI